MKGVVVKTCKTCGHFFRSEKSSDKAPGQCTALPPVFTGERDWQDKKLPTFNNINVFTNRKACIHYVESGEQKGVSRQSEDTDMVPF